MESKVIRIYCILIDSIFTGFYSKKSVLCIYLHRLNAERILDPMHAVVWLLWGFLGKQFSSTGELNI